MEKTAPIKFCVKLGKMFTETLQKCKAYGDDASSCTTVYIWYMWYKDGWESLEDDMHALMRVNMQCLYTYLCKSDAKVLNIHQYLSKKKTKFQIVV